MNKIKINIYSAIIMYIPHVLSHWCILVVEGESFKSVLADRVCPAAESSSVHRIDNAPIFLSHCSTRFVFEYRLKHVTQFSENASLSAFSSTSTNG